MAELVIDEQNSFTIDRFTIFKKEIKSAKYRALLDQGYNYEMDLSLLHFHTLNDKSQTARQRGFDNIRDDVHFELKRLAEQTGCHFKLGKKTAHRYVRIYFDNFDWLIVGKLTEGYPLYEAGRNSFVRQLM